MVSMTVCSSRDSMRPPSWRTRARNPALRLNRLSARPHVAGAVELSVIIGTVDRPKMAQDCVEAIREAAAGALSYEIVVAYGRRDDPALPWLQEQPDVKLVLGGTSGAVDAFNAAFAASGQGTGASSSRRKLRIPRSRTGSRSAIDPASSRR